MNETVNTIVELIVIFFVVKFLLDFITNRFQEKIKQAVEEQETDDANLMILDASQHNGTVLCYDADTGEFVCQGKNIDEISKNFKLRYPGKSVIIQGEQDIVDMLTKDGSTA